MSMHACMCVHTQHTHSWAHTHTYTTHTRTHTHTYTHTHTPNLTFEIFILHSIIERVGKNLLISHMYNLHQPKRSTTIPQDYNMALLLEK